MDLLHQKHQRAKRAGIRKDKVRNAENLLTLKRNFLQVSF